MTEFSELAGIWIGFVLSLMTFSVILRDNWLARLSQYILVGSATGYLVVLVIQDILRPKLIEPIFASEQTPFDLFIPLALGISLTISGLETLVNQGPVSQSSFQDHLNPVPARRSPIWHIMRFVGRVGVLLIIGVNIANSVTGIIQGTVLPQLWQATRIRSFGPDSSNFQFSAIVSLVLTIGVLLHLKVAPANHHASRHSIIRAVHRLGIASVWAGVGQRVLWFAIGILFARMTASRLSLLIIWIDERVQFLRLIPGWQNMSTFLQWLGIS